MIVPILKFGSPKLRKQSIEITGDIKLVKLVKDMFDTLKKDGGIGLAAPQIGVLKRLFIIDTSPFFDNDASNKAREEVFVNPEILEYSCQTSVYNEGCLSLPGLFEDVERSEKIRVRYQNLDFKTKEETLEGIEARIFQHEFDHLDGFLFIDKIGVKRRNLLNVKLNRIKNQ